jgi:hypothetical protein
MAMARDWALIHDLLGGTRAMRAAGETWLPREPRESLEAYRIRLSRSVLFNGLGRCLQTPTGKPFGKPATLSDDADPRIRSLLGDVDRSGRNLTVFARDVLAAALSDGLTHILVDHPIGEPGANLAEERARGDRPYLVHIQARDLIGWRHGEAGLDRIRIRERVIEPDRPWGERVVDQIRVLYPGRYEVWREAGDGADKTWRRIREGRSSMTGIPLVTIHAERKGFMTARAPLIDLAWLNLAHWQLASDQRHILHVARVPILFAKNLKAGDGGVEIGPNRMIIGEGEGADLRFVEHSGAAIAAGRQDLVDLEDRMAVMGLDLLSSRQGQMTATQRAIDADRADSALAAIVRGLEDGLSTAFGLAARWLDLSTESGGRVSIHQEFGLGRRDADEIDLLLKARLAGEIDRPTFLAEIRRRGVLAEEGMG